MGGVRNGKSAILRQTVTVKPNFGKAGQRGLERSSLAGGDRVTVWGANRRDSHADQDSGWLSGTIETTERLLATVKQGAFDARGQDAMVKRAICLIKMRRHLRSPMNRVHTVPRW
ncbi:hypothetical protein [Thalassospira lucentensis]|uniref:hypothetical protein n=1 Tax=Thalassospira lucentensis TaxID=168935 RepID=UPI003AA9661B